MWGVASDLDFCGLEPLPQLGTIGHVTTRSTSPGQPRRSPMLTFATKTLPTGANGQKADGTSPSVRAV